MAMTIVLRYVEDERAFSIVGFFKGKLRNKVGGHLPLCVQMFTQKYYTLKNFPYTEAVQAWRANKHRYCMNLQWIISLCFGWFLWLHSWPQATFSRCSSYRERQLNIIASRKTTSAQQVPKALFCTCQSRTRAQHACNNHIAAATIRIKQEKQKLQNNANSQKYSFDS